MDVDLNFARVVAKLGGMPASNAVNSNHHRCRIQEKKLMNSFLDGTGHFIALGKGMFRYGKLARQAVSAMSYLAERHGCDMPLISSAEVARARNIPPALAAKLLSEAAAAGLVRGVTGPGGGYRLSRPPEEIRLADIVRIFERDQTEHPCPFGPGWCGNGKPCPLHEDFVRLDMEGKRFLEETTLAVFGKDH